MSSMVTDPKFIEHDVRHLVSKIIGTGASYGLATGTLERTLIQVLRMVEDGYGSEDVRHLVHSRLEAQAHRVTTEWREGLLTNLENN